MTIENISRSTSTKVLGPELTTDCAAGPSHFGVPILFKDPESINSVFALFDCFRAILYELLFAWLIDLVVYQSGAYEAFAGVLVNKGKWHIFQGNRGRKAKF